MKTLIAFIILILNVLNGYSQLSCGFDQEHRRLLKTNSLYKKAFIASESKVKALLSDKDFMKIQAPVYRIPVVVHVIHNGEALGTGTNISDAQIQSAITSLTQYYRGTLGGSVDAEIEFELANLAPDCSPTSGIIRVNGSAIPNYPTLGLTFASSAGNELAVKALSIWPNQHYYNIWVVNEIDNNGGMGGVQGFAYFAGAPADRDGTVILASSFGYDPGGSLGYGLKSYTNLNITLTHEMGHAFGLFHTFEGQQDVNADGILECPLNTDCTVNGDRVCDTDPHIQSNSDCPGGTNSCSGLPNDNIVHNFLDYSSEACKTNFTAGQVNRMRSYMEATRPALISSQALNTASPLSPYVEPVAAVFTPATINTGPGNYAGIYNINLNQRNRSSDAAQSDSGYINGVGTCLNLIQLFRGSTYTITARLFGYYDEQFGVWIDYNNDGDFLDTNEQITLNTNITGTATVNQNLIVSATFTVPGSAPLSTAVRMRVMDDIGISYSLPPIASNTNSQYGQAEDYPVYFSSLLPIVLDKFNGELIDAHTMLTWNTASEVNAKGFEIERSYDGLEYTKIGYVAAGIGPVTQRRNYNFNDPDMARENNYYRLKQLDVDNKYEYSTVVYIKSVQFYKAGFRILNNPFSNIIDIAMVKIPKGRIEIRLFTVTGQEVFRKSEFGIASSKLSIDLSGKALLKGIYFLEITTNGEKFTERILKH